MPTEEPKDAQATRTAEVSTSVEVHLGRRRLDVGMTLHHLSWKIGASKTAIDRQEDALGGDHKPLPNARVPHRKVWAGGRHRKNRRDT